MKLPISGSMRLHHERRPRTSSNRKRRATIELLEGRALLSTTYTVTRGADDSNTGSLRWAINQVNADLTDSPASPDHIEFNIPTSDPSYNASTGVWTLSIGTTALPQVGGSAVIDGYTQPGASPNTADTTDNAVIKIAIEGAGQSSDGLNVVGNNSVIRGLEIGGFSGAALHVITERGGNLVEGNFLGFGPLGPTESDYQSLLVEGPGNTIGGTTPAARNVIGPAKYQDLAIGAYATTGLVEGNFIGLDVSGQFAPPNSSPVGIWLGAGSFPGGSGVTIGGTVSGARNIIAGVAGVGIWDAESVGHNLIEGNSIGTDPTGAFAISNGTGIEIQGDADTIGGVTTGAGNIIAGNVGAGILLGSSWFGNSLIEGNGIGTDMLGAINLGNGGSGIVVTTSDDVIGGDLAAANVIAFNRGDGVTVVSDSKLETVPTGVSILSNRIYENQKLGIDLGADGVTPNQPGGPHPGPNQLQNYPVLTLADSTGASTVVVGTLNSTPNTTFTIQVFANSGADPSGYGQGERYLGELTGLNTDATGNASFSFTVPGTAVGQFLSATATDSGGNTSEFAKDVLVGSVESSDIAVSVLNSTATTTYGGNVTYNFVISNNGPAAAPSVVVTDTLPSSMTGLVASSTLGTFTLTGNVFTNTVASLAAGASFQVSFTATAASTGTISNTLVATSFSLDPVPTNNSATVSTQVARAGTTSVLVASPTDSLSGQPVTLTATVSGPGHLTGIVTFLDGSAVLGQATLNSNGQAQLVVSTLAPGTHTLSVSYEGDANFAPSTSAIVGQIVNAIPTVVSVIRNGVHAQPTTLEIRFNTPLDSSRAQNLANYRLTGPHNRVIAVKSAVLASDGMTVTLRFRQSLNLHQTYVLKVIGTPPTGITSAAGVYLDGASTGVPGSNFVTTITSQNLRLPAVPTHARATNNKIEVKHPKGTIARTHQR